MVARIVFDQKMATWLWLHVEAFEELGGVPEVVVPDNLKSAVIRAAFGVGPYQKPGEAKHLDKCRSKADRCCNEQDHDGHH
jgi:transposase